MDRPPAPVNFPAPAAPQWRRWWIALLLLWSAQSALLWALWPAQLPGAVIWGWSALLPLGWAVALVVRVLGWQLRLREIAVYRQVHAAEAAQWWQQRAQALPVEEVLLLGPVGVAQGAFERLMAFTASPGRQHPDGVLRCPIALNDQHDRSPGLARQLAQCALTLPHLSRRWPCVRALCWAGNRQGETAFVQALSSHGLAPPQVRMPLQDLGDLDALISGFYQHCNRTEDWLLCAGVVSASPTASEPMAGEGGFVWLVGHRASVRLHRSERLAQAHGDDAAELCEQIQRYAGLCAPPDDCLAMDQTSSGAFVAGGWCGSQHQLFDKWGGLAQLAPFIGMSVALLQARLSRQACGWLSQDGHGRSAIGVAMPYEHH